jgi:MFS family permease
MNRFLTQNLQSKMNRQRLSVNLIFFVNGFMFANWIARLPEIQELYALTKTQLGTVLLTSAMGAIIAMPFAGWFAVRFGSYRITIFTALAFCFCLPFLPVLPFAAALGALLFVFGLNGGAMDVSMNEQAVLVEKQYDKPIMSSFHAVFSVGTALGAGAGSLFAKFDISLFSHFLATAIFCLILVLLSIPNLIKIEIQKERQDRDEPSFMLPTKAILPLGVIAFCGMTGEGSLSDWSAIYLTDILKKTPDVAAWGFGAFATAMTIGRILGDNIAARLGKRNTLIYSSLCSIFGLCVALALPELWVVLMGFALVGLGLSNVVPIVYSTAGNTEGIKPSVGIAMATTIGYAGFFVGPPIIGFLGDSFGLRIGLCFTLCLFVVMFGLVRRLRLKE